MNPTIPEEALKEYYTESEEILQRVSGMLSSVKNEQFSTESIDSLYRDIHTLKGTSQLFGFHFIGTLSHSLEACLEPVRQKKIKMDSQFIDIFYKSLDFIENILKNPGLDLNKNIETEKKLNNLVASLVTFATHKMNGDFQLYRDEIPSENFVKEGHMNIDNKQIDNDAVEITKNKAESEIENGKLDLSLNNDHGKSENIKAPVSAAESSSVRVHVELLDKLMNLAGEMVLVRNQVLQHAKKSEDNNYLNLIQRLDLVTSELQDQIMRTRMQPVGSVFTKFQRLVRDVSKDLGKKIELKISGADTELDKSLIEAIKDPLTHIIRNSCDHGIETIEEREKSGKTPLSIVHVKAYQEGGTVVIEVEDDGRGIHSDKILAKAIEKKLITQEKAQMMSEKEVLQLIFAPGFSTAEKVSAVSGRGVGMDVVKTNIEKVGGAVDVETKIGFGTKMKLKIPLTLAVVPAMIVYSSNNYYAIAQSKVQELIRIDMLADGAKIEHLQNKPFLRLRGELLPLAHLNEILFSKSIDVKDIEIYNIVVIQGEKGRYGVIVDDIMDTTDIVVKPLAGYLKKIGVFSGASILGDGKVALILDTLGFAEKAHTTVLQKENNKENINETSKNSIDYGEYVIFSLFTPGLYCIPLSLVQRLEEFEYNGIEMSGTEYFMQYRGGLLPIISLDKELGFTKEFQMKKDEKVSVIVVSKRNKLFGLLVNEILDLQAIKSEITSLVHEEKGILGSLLSESKKVITIVDVMVILSALLGEKQEDTKSKKFNKGKILFAEDTAFFAKQVKKLLEGAGLSVVHASDGVEALQIIENSKESEYDLVLSDIEMPKMNGFDLAVEIRKNKIHKNIPMIAITTRFRELDQKKGIEVGFNKYLEKLKSDELLDAIGSFISGG